MANPPKLLDQVREKVRVKHYAICTEQTYVDWIRRFILFHDKRHPKDFGAPQRVPVWTVPPLINLKVTPHTPVVSPMDQQ